MGKVWDSWLDAAETPTPLACMRFGAMSIGSILILIALAAWLWGIDAIPIVGLVAATAKVILAEVMVRRRLRRAA